MLDRAREYQRCAQRYQAGARGERAVAAALHPLTECGWVMLADRRWPNTAAANIDLMLVGPGGVVVVDAKNWKEPSHVVDGRLVAGARPCDDEVDKLLAITKWVEDVLAELSVSPAAVSPMMVFTRGPVDVVIRRVHVASADKARAAIAGCRTRLDEGAVRKVAAHLGESVWLWRVCSCCPVCGSRRRDSARWLASLRRQRQRPGPARVLQRGGCGDRPAQPDHVRVALIDG